MTLAYYDKLDNCIYYLTITHSGITKHKTDFASSGVYVGSGEMPEDCNVQIDPEGSTPELATVDYVDNLVTSALGNIELELEELL